MTKSVTPPNQSPTPTRGVPIELDRTRHLRYSLATTRKMREKFGDTFEKEGIGDEAIAEVLWFGLKHEDDEITIEAIEEMVDLQNLATVMSCVMEAMGQKVNPQLAVVAATPAAAEQQVASEATNENALHTDKKI